MGRAVDTVLRGAVRTCSEPCALGGGVDEGRPHVQHERELEHRDEQHDDEPTDEDEPDGGRACVRGT